MWIALYLIGLEFCLAAIGLGVARRGAGGNVAEATGRAGKEPIERRTAEGGGVTHEAGATAASSAGRGGAGTAWWIELGLLAQLAALFGLAGTATRLARPTVAWLGAGGALMTFCWLGAWLRRTKDDGRRAKNEERGTKGEGRRAGGLWIGILLVGELGLVALTAARMGAEYVPAMPPDPPTGFMRLEPRAAATFIGLGLFEGGMLLLILLYWLRALGGWPEGTTLREAGVRPAALAASVAAFLLLRIMAIALSLWLGAMFNPIGGRFFLHALAREGWALLYARWMVGLVVPGTMALTMAMDREEMSVATVQFQLLPMLVMVALGEFLGCAMVAASGGLAL